jgi:hypothetical protein
VELGQGRLPWCGVVFFFHGVFRFHLLCFVLMELLNISVLRSGRWRRSGVGAGLPPACLLEALRSFFMQVIFSFMFDVVSASCLNPDGLPGGCFLRQRENSGSDLIPWWRTGADVLEEGLGFHDDGVDAPAGNGITSHVDFSLAVGGLWERQFIQGRVLELGERTHPARGRNSKHRRRLNLGKWDGCERRVTLFKLCVPPLGQVEMFNQHRSALGSRLAQGVGSNHGVMVVPRAG